MTQPKLRNTYIAVAACLAAFFAVVFADADVTEEASVSYTLSDDGGCPEVGHTVSGGYSRVSDHLAIDASVRVAPSGGDCRVDGLSLIHISEPTRPY